MDWGLGRYELLASRLLPVAQVVVGEADPQPGMDVIDVGCGTGNASIVAAGRGARVTGVDPSARLLDVARGRTTASGLDISFVSGDAAHLPVQDDSADALVSVFALIWEPDAQAVAVESRRVLRRGGRLVLSAWYRDGVLHAQSALRDELLAAAGAPPAPGMRFPWQDESAVADLLGPLGFAVKTQEHPHVVTDASPEAHADRELTAHPRWAAVRAAVEPLGQWEAVRPALVERFRAVNEDPSSFRTTSRYVVVTATLT